MRTVVCVSLWKWKNRSDEYRALRTPTNAGTSCPVMDTFLCPRGRPYHFFQFNPLNNADNGHLFLAQSTDSHKQ